MTPSLKIGEYLGRNRVGKLVGLDVQPSDYLGGCVMLSPINSRGVSTACTLFIPHEMLPSLVSALSSAYNEGVKS